MELDDLRRQWQQPDPAALPFISAAQLQGLMQRPPTDVISKMRRNTWIETALTAAVAVAALVYLVAWPAPVLYRLIYGFLFLLLALGLLFHYYLQLGLLRRMAHAEVHIRKHLGVLCAGLRGQIQFYYRLTVTMVPLTTLLNLSLFVGLELGHAAPFRWGLFGLTASLLLLGAAVLQVPAVYGTRWYLQRLYGQHLDRLEASLRELSDEPAG